MTVAKQATAPTCSPTVVGSELGCLHTNHDEASQEEAGTLSCHSPLALLKEQHFITAEIAELVRKVIATYEVPICCLAFDHPSGMVLKVRHGIEHSFLRHPPGGQSICLHPIDRKLPIIISDASKDTRYIEDEIVAGTTGVRFFAGAPLTSTGKDSKGTLCIMDTRPREDFGLKQSEELMQAAEYISWLCEEAYKVENLRLMATKPALECVDEFPSETECGVMFPSKTESGDACRSETA